MQDGTHEKFRSILRSIAVTGLASIYRLTGIIDTALTRNRVQFITFHDLPECLERPFRDLLLHLQRNHTFISYSAAVTRVLQGAIDRPYLTVTFDDGLYGGKRAARIMTDLGIQGCFFLCPTGLSATSPSEIKTFCNRIRVQPSRLLSWRDAEEILNLNQEIGSHTVSHPNIASLPLSESELEIGGSYSALEQRFGRLLHFAWPFGRFRQFTALAAKAVFHSGFYSCASGVRGCHRNTSSMLNIDLCIRRDVFEPFWPLQHIDYFLARNSISSSEADGSWPPSWRSVLRESTLTGQVTSNLKLG